MQLDEALTEWKSLLNADYVLTEEHLRDEYARSTQPRGTRPSAILLPSTVAEVCQTVRIASQYSVPLYPISRGKNWGYGDACAVTDHQVIVDLQRMNRIEEVNVPLAYAVIEPGVTQQQMYEYLLTHNTPLWLDVTGAGPEASIIGNVLERGFGHTPYGDHYHTSAGYEVVLADGQVFTTGFGHYTNARATYTFKPGLGPSLDGLFTQSNFGIITKMGVWLMPKPQYLQGFVFSVSQHQAIVEVVDALRVLRLHDLVRGTIHIANDLRVLSARQRYPWEQTHGLTPLPETVRQSLRQQAAVGAWNVLGGLYGTRTTVAATRKELRRALHSIAKVKFFDNRLLAVATKVGNMLQHIGLGQRLNEQIHAIQPAFALLQGIPTPEHLAGSGWRSRREPLPGNNDPLDNQWGFFWLSPIIPMLGTVALDFLKIVEPIFQAHGFEPLITMTSITPRALCCVMTVAYDKSNPIECAQATACYEQLFHIVVEQGYIPYRAGIQSMEKLVDRSTVFWDVTSRIKQALDPQAILSPGHYVPQQRSPDR